MNPTEFAYKHLGEFKQKGNEIVPKYCPYCNGGDRRDRESFALNVEKLTYNCKRSSCDKSGTFHQLCKDFGEEADRENFELIQRPKKVYKQPESTVSPATKRVEDYLRLRGFSKETWERRGVGEVGGNIAFPYYENGELVLMKFRKPEKYKGNGRKAWREEGGKPVLWGMDLCDTSKPLTITEGECFPGDVEVLTPSGWTSLEKYNGQPVLQVHDDLTASFVEAKAYIQKPYDGELLRVERGGNYVTMTTPDHNIVYADTKGVIHKRQAEKMPKTLGGIIPTTVMLNGQGIPLSNTQIALSLALSADGTIDNRINSGYKGKYAREKRYARFAFKKARKSKRLVGLLHELGIEYYRGLNANKQDSICFPLPDWASGKLLPVEWLSQATFEQRNFILDEMVYWDGNKVVNRNQTEYSSKIYHNAVFIQTMAHTSGRMSTVMKRVNRFGQCYKVSVLHGKRHVTWQNITPQKVKHDGYVYCVTVPSGMLLVRQEGHITVSGNCDALALEEAGVQNAVSVPSGASDLTWIETCWEWLEQFNKIILWGDNDDAGKEMVRKVILRLGEWRCYVVKSPHKDANVSLVREGKEATKRYVDEAQPVPINGLIELADVKPVDNSKIERVKTNIKMLDKSIGGLLFGELSVWTGRNGEGKSTLLSQLLLETVDQGYGVCAYSGELRADRFQYWVNLQAAGKENIQSYFDPVREADIPYLTKDINNSIREWYRGKFFLYDNATHPEENGILKIFTYAAKRYDCKVFLVDNLMTSRFDAKNDNDFYREQSRFVGDLVHFAKAYNVHVHLVAHPKKTKEALQKEDIMGSGEITHRADNVFAVARTTERTDTDADTVISVLKNRSDGVQGKDIGLMFDKTSKRFWQQSDPTAQFKKYGWQKVEQIELEPEVACPWD